MRNKAPTAANRHKQPKRYYLTDSNPSAYLTNRELDVSLELVKGKTHEEIAQVLNLSRRTIECYTNSLRAKLNCRNKRCLVNYLSQFNLRHLRYNGVLSKQAVRLLIIDENSMIHQIMESHFAKNSLVKSCSMVTLREALSHTERCQYANFIVINEASSYPNWKKHLTTIKQIYRDQPIIVNLSRMCHHVDQWIHSDVQAVLIGADPDGVLAAIEAAMLGYRKINISYNH